MLNKRDTKNFIIYFGFDAINKALPFLIVPIIAKYITTAEFGLLSNFMVLSQIFYVFLTFNNFTKLSTSYFKIKENLSFSFFNYVYFSSILLLIFILVVYLLRGVLVQYFRISFQLQSIALFVAYCSAILNLYTTLLRMQEKPVLFGITQLTQSFSLFVIVILLVVVLKQGWMGRIHAQLYSSVLAIAFCFSFLNRHIGIYPAKFDGFHFKEIFLWGLPLLPHSLSFWLKSSADKIIITNLVGLSANGVYSVALTIGGIISLFSASFFNMYTPKVFKELTIHEGLEESNVEGKKEIEKKLVRNLYFFSLIVGAICIVAYFAIVFLFKIFFSGDYLAAISFLHLVLINSFLGVVYSLVSAFLFFKSKTKIIGSITFSLAIAQVVLTYLLVQYYDVYGALYSSIIISICTSVLILYFTNREYKLPWLSFTK